MRNRYYRKMIAFLIAASMILSGAVPVYAEEIPEAIASSNSVAAIDEADKAGIDEEMTQIDEAEPELVTDSDDASVASYGAAADSFETRISEVEGTVSEGEPRMDGGVYWYFTDASNKTLVVSENKDAGSSAGYIDDCSWKPGDAVGKGNWLNEYAGTIEKVQFIGNIKRIGNFAFAGCTNLITIVVPTTCEDIGFAPFVNCSSLGSIRVEDENNSNFKTEYNNRILYKKADQSGTNDHKELVCVPGYYSGTLTIHDETEEIKDYAFVNCSSITNRVTIPKSVKTIGEKAFYGCTGITELRTGTRPGTGEDKSPSLNSIGSQAFYGCTRIKKIFLPDTLRSEGQVYDDSFSGCTGVKYVVYYATENEGDIDEQVRQLKIRFANAGINMSTENICYCPYGYWVVFFDPGNGTMTKTVSAVSADKEYTLETPEYTGYIFNYWHYKSGHSTKIHKGETINFSADTELVAEYYCEYTLTFTYVSMNGNDTENVTKTITVSSGTVLDDYKDKINKIVPPEIDTGDFKAWRSEKKKALYGPNATSEIYAYSRYGEIRQDDTFTAVYTNRYVVKFYAPDGELLKTQYCKAGAKITGFDAVSQNEYLLNNYPEDRYDFKGWYRSNGSVKWSKETPVYQNLELYAKYNRFIIVTYNYMYAYDGVNTVKTIKHTYNTDLDIAVANDREGYEFRGWYDQPDGKGNLYATRIPNARKDLELYAYWVPRYKVTFYKFASDDPDNPYAETDYITSGNKIYLQMPDAPHLDGHAFTGWYTEDGEMVTGAYVVTQNLKVYAEFKEGYFNIFYYDGDDQIDTQAVLKGDTIKESTGVGVPTQQMLEDIGFTKRGYTLIGWNTKKDGSGEDITDDYVVTGDIYCYAQWYDDPNEENYIYYIVSFNSMGGSEVPSQRISENGLITEPSVPTRSQYKFLGWYRDTSYAEQWDFSKDVVTNDMYLYAKWMSWTDEQEAERQDNLNGIYWVKIIKNQEVSIASYFVGAAKLKAEDKKIAKVNSKKRTVKGKKAGSTLITGTFASDAEAKSVRLFVYNQTISQMSAVNTHTSMNAIDHLAYPELLPTTWKSTNAKVASIDPKTGEITVRKRGTTKIIAYYGKIKVTGKLVCGVPQFTRKYIRIVPGQTKKLRIKGVKDYTIVSYNSPSANGRQIAEIDANGMITGINAGESTISANVLGENISCKLFVQQPSLATTKLAMKLDTTKKIKLKHCKLQVVEWQSSNNGVAFVDPTNGTVYAVGKGTATIRTNAGGVTNTIVVTVTEPVKSTKDTTTRKTKK